MPRLPQVGSEGEGVLCPKADVEVLGDLGLESAVRPFGGGSAAYVGQGLCPLSISEADEMRQEGLRGVFMAFGVQGLCWGLGRQEAGWQGWCQAASARAERPHCWCSAGLPGL